MALRCIQAGVLALVLALCAGGAIEAATIVFDDFEDDGTGDLTGETASSGQGWSLSSKGEVTGTLVTGSQYGQSGSNGAGDAESGGSKVWRGNMLSIGRNLGESADTYVLAVDFKKQHSGGSANQLGIILRSTTQGNKETVMQWRSDWLEVIGSWSFGGGQLNTGVPGDIHAELTFNLVPDGDNTVSLSWYKIGEPAVNGQMDLPSSIVGTLKYDEIHVLTWTLNSKIVGYDNLSLTDSVTPPDPGTVIIVK